MPNVVTAPKVRRRKNVTSCSVMTAVARRADRRDLARLCTTSKRSRRASAGSSTCSASVRADAPAVLAGQRANRGRSRPSRRHAARGRPSGGDHREPRVRERAARAPAPARAGRSPAHPSRRVEEQRVERDAADRHGGDATVARRDGLLRLARRAGYFRDVTRHFPPDARDPRRRLRDALARRPLRRLHRHRRLARRRRGGRAAQGPRDRAGRRRRAAAVRGRALRRRRAEGSARARRRSRRRRRRGAARAAARRARVRLLARRPALGVGRLHPPAPVHAPGFRLLFADQGFAWAASATSRSCRGPASCRATRSASAGRACSRQPRGCRSCGATCGSSRGGPRDRRADDLVAPVREGLRSARLRRRAAHGDAARHRRPGLAPGREVHRKLWEYAMLGALSRGGRARCARTRRSSRSPRAPRSRCTGSPTAWEASSRPTSTARASFAYREAAATMLTDPPLRALSFREDRLEVRSMDALALDFPDASFDVVYSLSSIEHFGGPRETATAAREMARVLRPGGHVAIVDGVPARPPPARRPARQLRDPARVARAPLRDRDAAPPRDRRLHGARAAARHRRSQRPRARPAAEPRAVAAQPRQHHPRGASTGRSTPSATRHGRTSCSRRSARRGRRCSSRCASRLD